MKIAIDRDIVELLPESEQEAEDLAALWNVVVDCIRYNKKLVPIGEYIPGETNRASFHIED